MHYRGRHSPGSSFVRFACRFLFFGFVRFLPLTQLLFARSAVSPKKNSTKLELLLLLVLLPGTCTGFSERKFSRSHAHFDCFFFFSQRISFAFAWCYQKMHYFCLAAKNDFLSISLHLHFWLFSPIFLGIFQLFNKPLFFFFCKEKKEKKSENSLASWLVFFMFSQHRLIFSTVVLTRTF